MDIALVLQSDGSWDIALDGADLLADNTPRTAIVLSVLSDRRAAADDILPNPGDADLRGWWADAFPTMDGDLWGSRLWLLARAKQTQDTLNSAQTFIDEAVAWLSEDGISDAITVTASYPDIGAMSIEAVIPRPVGGPLKQTFAALWNAESQVQ